MGTTTEIMMEEWLSAMESMGGGLELLNVVLSGFSNIFSIATYILTSLALYSIAKRRNISNPWLAWIPVGNLWIMGSISDDYQRVVKFQSKNRRKWILGLYIATIAVAFVMIGVLVATMVVAVGTGLGGSVEDVDWLPAAGGLVAIILLSMVMMAVAIWASVVEYMALYDIYRSCDSKNATLYLVLSIFVSITMPIFLLLCRDKDDLSYTMRKQVPAAPQWTPPQSTQEPWEN